MVSKTILIIDDDVDLCQLLSNFLTRNGYRIETAHNGKKGIELFKTDAPDLVLTDFRLGDMTGLEVVKALQSLNPFIPVICMTGYTDINCVVLLIKNGCYDYMEKPIFQEILLKKIQNAFDDRSNSKDNMPSEIQGRQSHPASQTMNLSPENRYYCFRSEAMQRVYKEVELIAPTDYNVILFGESGTGKEVIAHALHSHSSRRNKPFVAVDCGVLSQDLSASELFGHTKGAFTGALNDRVGYFETANGGTLFLDEIGNLSFSVQVQLLRVLQEKTFRRIGSMEEIKTDIRIIVASNENLKEAVKKGNFREDLFHRLNEYSIDIPSLRECRPDLQPLAEYFLHISATELGKDLPGFKEDAMERIIHYPWPGNVRELRNVVRRAAVMTDNGKYIELSALPFDLLLNKREDINYPSQESSSSDAHPAYIPALEEMKDVPYSLKKASSLAENDLIIMALRKVNFNKKRAAELLRIDRKTLYNKLRNITGI